jgi:hypothetical protein
MVGPFAVEGYDVLAPLDEVGRRWRAICREDGRPVVLRRWVGAAGRRAEVRRRAALWGAVEAAVPVRDVLADGADLVVVSEAGGDSLGASLRRAALTPGQVVTLVVGVATALADAHQRGLAHGRLDASSVVLDSVGRPRLTDYAVGPDADPSADVAALVALASESLDSTAPQALVRALECAVDARDVVEQVLAAARAEPLLTRPASPPPAAPMTRLPASTRRRTAVVLTVAAAVFATGIGVWWGHQEPAAGAPMPRPLATATASPSMTPTPATAASMPTVVRALEQRRLHALGRADVGELAAVELRGTTLWRRDSRVVSRLRAMHGYLRGLAVRLLSVHVDTVTERRATVRVVDTLTAYDVVDGNGVVVAHHRARPARATTLVLVRDNGSWRLNQVR